MSEIEGFDNGLDVELLILNINQHKDENTIKESFEKAMKLDFLVPYLDKETRLFVINTKEKGKMFPAFSNYTEFLKSNLPNDKVKIMSFASLQNIVNSSNGNINGIVINPHGKSLMFEHHKNEAVEHNSKQKLHLSKPNFIPDVFKDNLKKILSENEKVYKSFVLWAQRDNDLSPHIFIIIDFDGDKETYLPSVAEKIKPFVTKGESIEFAKADFNLLKLAQKADEPFYVKN